MGLLDKLKSLFGSESTGRRREAGQPEGTTETDVTIEHEPDAESEHAVKGTGGADTAGTDERAEPTDEKPDPDTDGTDTTDQEGEPSPPVEEIKGIGPTYADRLGAAGIETVADLAAADVEAVAEAAETTETRASDWIERARES